MPLFPKTLPSLLCSILPVALIPLLLLMCSNSTILLEWSFLPLPNNHIFLPILIDTKSLTMALTVTFIAANIYQFSKSYMAADPFMNRFSILLFLFILSMYLLILTPHFMFILLGWDGLGITSFLLIIYYQVPTSLSAGMLTALSNRIGDSLILASISLMLMNNSWTMLNPPSPMLSQIPMILLVVAAMTKSAQLPFSSWLPAAMAAPTPVSALVHSSTLVTAGVFLLIRLHPILSEHPSSMALLLVMGTLTMFLASTSAVVETDLKKVIALSTLSQLGLMMMTIAINLPTLAFFHLITHAFFKALLFICAGSMIHYYAHSQDVRNLNLTATQMPLTAASMIMAMMALCGMPFLAGYYSKDMILENLFFAPANATIFLLAMVSTLFTTLYSLRIVYHTFLAPIQFQPHHSINHSNPHFDPAQMAMTLGAITAGTAMNWTLFAPMAHPNLPITMKLTPLLLIISAATVVQLTKSPSYPNTWPKTTPLYAASSMWFLTPLSTQNMIKSPLFSSAKLIMTLEHGWMEATISNNLRLSMTKTVLFFTSPQTTTINMQLMIPCLILTPLLLGFPS